MGYPELAQLLRRRGVLDSADVHEKNHVLLVGDAQHYELSPAFDVLPSSQALGYQQMRVGETQADSTLANAMSICTLFALRKDQGAQDARKVCRAVAHDAARCCSIILSF